MTEPQVPPAPLPTQTVVGTAQTPDGGRVILQAVTPAGMGFYFMSPEHARIVAAQLNEASDQVDTGLIIARDVPQTNGHFKGLKAEAN